MNFKDYLKLMLNSFFIIVARITAGYYIICAVFMPSAIFTYKVFGQILLIAFICVLPHFIFYSKKEYGKKEMLVRKIIHFILLMSILGFFGVTKWIDPKNILQIIVLFSIIIAVYLGVWAYMGAAEKKEAKIISKAIEQYKNKSE